MLRTGSLALDIAFGGGWKPGTINEIWGGPGSGKTTFGEHAVWELETGRTALWLSMGAEIPHRPSGALLAQPRNAEQAFYIMDTAVRGDISLIVVDSANGLIRQRELDGDPDYEPDPHREYKNELSGLKEGCKAHGAIVLFLSKPRDRDRQPIRGTGISEKSKDRVKLKIIHEKQDGTKTVQLDVRDREPEAVRIVPGTGIDWANEMVRLGVRYDIIKFNAPWYTFKIGTETMRIQGIEAAADLIRERTELAVNLDESIRYLAEIGD